MHIPTHTYTEKISHSALTDKFLHSKGYITEGYICEPLVNGHIWKMVIPILLRKRIHLWDQRKHSRRHYISGIPYPSDNFVEVR